MMFIISALKPTCFKLHLTICVTLKLTLSRVLLSYLLNRRQNKNVFSLHFLSLAEELHSCYLTLVVASQKEIVERHVRYCTAMLKFNCVDIV
jgi:hypothetical protein